MNIFLNFSQFYCEMPLFRQQISFEFENENDWESHLVNEIEN
jgi:hypothetical protein